MDDRISSAAYNPFNDYDISTARGNQRLSEDLEADARAYAATGNFSSQVRFALIQLGIFAAIGIGFVIFG